MKGTERWSELKSIVKIETKQEINGNLSEETRYYISSLYITAEKMNACVSAHSQSSQRVDFISLAFFAFFTLRDQLGFWNRAKVI